MRDMLLLLFCLFGIFVVTVCGNSAPWSVPSSGTGVASFASVPANQTTCPGGINFIINGAVFACVGGPGAQPVLNNCANGLTGIQLNGTLVCGTVGRNLAAGSNDTNCTYGGFEFSFNEFMTIICYDDPNESLEFSDLWQNQNATSAIALSNNATVASLLSLFSSLNIQGGRSISVLKINATLFQVDFNGALQYNGSHYSLIVNASTLELVGLEAGNGVSIVPDGNDLLLSSDIHFYTTGTGDASLIQSNNAYSVTLREPKSNIPHFFINPYIDTLVFSSDVICDDGRPSLSFNGSLFCDISEVATVNSASCNGATMYSLYANGTFLKSTCASASAVFSDAYNASQCTGRAITLVTPNGVETWCSVGDPVYAPANVTLWSLVPSTMSVALDQLRLDVTNNNNVFVNSSTVTFSVTPSNITANAILSLLDVDVGGVSLIDHADANTGYFKKLFGLGAVSIFRNTSGVYVSVPPALLSYSITSTNNVTSLISSSTATSTVLNSLGDTPSLAFSSSGGIITGDVTITSTDLTSGYSSVIGGCTGNNCNFRQFRAYDSSILDVQQDTTTIFVKSNLRAQNLPYPNVSISLFPDCPFAMTQADINVCLAQRTVASLTNVTNAASVFYTPATPFRNQSSFSVASALSLLFDKRLPLFTRIWNVDDMNGDDVLGDGSPLNPFKTIGKTFSAIGTFDTSQAQEVHLAIGTYNEGSLQWPPNTFITVNGILRVVNVNVNGTISLRSDWATAGSIVQSGISGVVISANAINMDYTMMGPAPPSSIAAFYFTNCNLDAPFTGTGRGSTDLFHFLLNDMDLPNSVNCANVHLERNNFNIGSNTIFTDTACSAPLLEWHATFNYFDQTNFTASQSTSTLIIMDSFLNGWDRGFVFMYAATMGGMTFNTFTMPVTIFVQATVTVNYNLNLVSSQMCGLDVTYWGASCLNGGQMMLILMGRSKNFISSGTGQVSSIYSTSSTAITLNEFTSALSSLLLSTSGTGSILLTPNLFLTVAGSGISMVNNGSASSHILKTFGNTNSLTWNTNATTVTADINFATSTSGNGGTSLIQSATGQSLILKELFASGASSIINNATGIYIITPPGLYTFTDHSVGTAFSWIQYQNATDTYFKGPTAGNTALTISATTSDIVFTPNLPLTDTGNGVSVINTGSVTSHILRTFFNTTSLKWNSNTTTVYADINFAVSTSGNGGASLISSTTGQTLVTKELFASNGNSIVNNATGIYIVGSGSGVQSTTAGTNIVQTGTATNPIISTTPTPTFTSETLSAVSSQLTFGTTTTTTLSVVTPASSRTHALNDPGTNSAFVMADGSQTINGVKTFTSAPVSSANVGHKFNNAANTFGTTLTAGTGLASSFNIAMPISTGTLNQVLVTDGGANPQLSWLSAPIRIFEATASAAASGNPGAGVFVSMNGGTGVGSTTITGNTLRAGSTIEIALSGIFSVSNGGTYQLRVAFGGTTVATSITSSSGNPSQTNAPFTVFARLTVRSIGATGTIVGSAVFNCDNLFYPTIVSSTTAATVNTAANALVDVRFAYMGNSGSNTFTTVMHVIKVTY